MIESGEVKNESDLARKLGISRVRVNQIIRLLKLDKEIIETVEEIGDPMASRVITERFLRSYIKNPKEYKNKLLGKLSKVE